MIRETGASEIQTRCTRTSLPSSVDGSETVQRMPETPSFQSFLLRFHRESPWRGKIIWSVPESTAKHHRLFASPEHAFSIIKETLADIEQSDDASARSKTTSLSKPDTNSRPFSAMACLRRFFGDRR